tara:strand:- start:1012 stop:1224 length:213 start_codon:yes stop_codon:yes gene_type:complete
VATYYVDKTLGSNDNTGLTTSDPFETLSQLESDIGANDTGLLLRGETWAEGFASGWVPQVGGKLGQEFFS